MKADNSNGLSDSSINTQPDDVMADFQQPDELRKQLEYPASMKKRQLAVAHAEQKLVERLASINSRLKEDKAKVSVQRVGDSLCLQATLPLKPDEVSKDGNPNKQVKVSLGIPFSVDGLKTAEEEARELAKLIARKTFTWNEKYLRTKAPIVEAPKTIGELLEEFERKYFLTRKRNRQSESSFNGYVTSIRVFRLLNEHLTKTVIMNAIEKTEAGSSSRNQLVSTLSVLCNTFKLDFSFKGLKDGYEPKKRLLPNDKEIEEKFDNFKSSNHNIDYQWQQWQWVYGILATYGLRPHEVFAIDVARFVDSTNVMHELTLDESLTEGVKTGNRVVFPLHPEWVTLFDLKNVKVLKTTSIFANRTGLISTNFLNNKIGFPPYHLRHAYAVRGHALGVPLKEMADNMGHSVDMHTKTYQKYMDINTRRVVYKAAINKATAAKAELTEVEQLKAEVAELKAENERLRALLVEQQMNDAIKG